MKTDQRELDDAAEAPKGSLAEGLTGMVKSFLDNPVLPSQFGFLDRSSPRAQPDVYPSATTKWERAA